LLRGVKTTLRCLALGKLNFDRITEGEQKEFLDRINKINMIGTEGTQGNFDRRDMRAGEGKLSREVSGVHCSLFLKELSFQARSGCKSLSPTLIHGGVYLRKPLRVV